ncbi:hypothetical protein [Paraburkholderia aromaticivorans]|uniref:hypothetical protein n=1 Tax=Paraburkholderia aromaticivorans TaxID=2026199 RepID=UPI0014561F96|nr:hypothetical protein [Paraburkholderia aromaticivorans]
MALALVCPAASERDHQIDHRWLTCVHHHEERISERAPGRPGRLYKPRGGRFRRAFADHNSAESVNVATRAFRKLAVIASTVFDSLLDTTCKLHGQSQCATDTDLCAMEKHSRVQFINQRIVEHVELLRLPRGTTPGPQSNISMRASEDRGRQR